MPHTFQPLLMFLWLCFVASVYGLRVDPVISYEDKATYGFYPSCVATNSKRAYAYAKSDNGGSLFVFDLNNPASEPSKIRFGPSRVKFTGCDQESVVLGGLNWKTSALWGVTATDWSYRSVTLPVREIGDMRYYSGVILKNTLLVFQVSNVTSNGLDIRQYNPSDGKEIPNSLYTWKNPLSFGNFLEEPFLFPSANGRYLLGTVDDCYAPLKRGPYHCNPDVLVWENNGGNLKLLFNASRINSRTISLAAISDSGRLVAFPWSGLGVYWRNDDGKWGLSYFNSFSSADPSQLKFITVEGPNGPRDLLLVITQSEVSVVEFVTTPQGPDTKVLWRQTAFRCNNGQFPVRINSFFSGNWLGPSFIAVGSVSCINATLPRTQDTTTFRILDAETGNAVWYDSGNTPTGLSLLRVAEAQPGVFYVTVPFEDRQNRMLKVYSVNTN